ncbi:MAG: hypothetical protein R3213_08545 [Flavobacteriaceae bacterium]|nr:hypothetical protein [Flavobacteriaceae bacterium]
MKKFYSQILTVLSILLVLSCSTAKKSNGKTSKGTASTEAKKPGKDDIQHYSKIITKEAVSDSGLFVVHKIDS